MGPGRATRRRGGVLIPMTLASALLASAGATPLYGESRLAEATVAPSSFERVSPPPAPSLAAPSWMGSSTSPQAIIRLAWYDVERLFRADFDLVADDMAARFRLSGVMLLWRQGEIGISIEDAAPEEVPVILFAADTSRCGRGRPVLASTTTTDPGPRVVTVFLGPIRAVLGLPSLGNALKPAELRQLARAVARVIAHELVHALAPDQAHSACGLMKRSFSRVDLLAPLTTADAQVVRAALTTRGHPAAALSSSQPAHN